MLIKEYHIPLPLTVEEYRIAQLYMIAKKSREESKGAGSGVEILVNEPYDDGPGGQGQYTHKIYHVGSHLPGWFKSLLPKSALTVEEEAWNAYPYTKTRYTCPFVEKFSLEIETYYYADNGHQENVFGLTGSDLRNRVTDLIDVVKDQLYGADYVREEDPKMYVSQKTGRGPLSESWLEDYWNECKGKSMPLPNGKSIMCAYKLCRVEFRYWGMQTKLEKFIHDVALRKTMLRAHRQAWAWQDEWHGLTMDDIRQIERQTQEALKRKMGVADNETPDSGDELDHAPNGSTTGNVTTPQDSSVAKTLQATLGSIEKTEEMPSPPVIKKSEAVPTINTDGSEGDISPEDSPTEIILRHPEETGITTDKETENRRKLWTRSNSKAALHSPSSTSSKSFDLQMANWRMESIVRDSDSGSDDEFFDCQADSIFSHTFLQRVVSERGRTMATSSSIDISCPGSPVMTPTHHSTCSTTVLILVLHAGSVLDANVDLTAKKSDITTFRGAFESVMRQHYPSMVGHIAIRLVSCPSICTEGLGILSSLSPYSFDVSPSCTDTPHVTHDSIPIGAIPIFASSTPEYLDAVSRIINGANTVYQEFLKSDEGHGFNGQICFVGDGVGSILGYDALCRTGQYQSRHDSENSILDTDGPAAEETIEISAEGLHPNKHLSAPAPRRRSSSTRQGLNDHQCKLEFEVSDFFMFGSPLALVLAYRKISSTEDKNMEIIQANPQMFAEGLNVGPPTPGSHLRRLSEVSLQSTISGVIDSLPLQTINALTLKWWGPKRLDYALYCPEGLANFPTNALPHLFHASYWESSDVIAFILRQLGRIDLVPTSGHDDKEFTTFSPSQPREKWIKKRTSVKLKNVAANHRANDVIVKEGAPQVLLARFMYGPLDMITLAGEKVDIHVMKDAPAGEWSLVATEVTDKTGRVTYTFPEDSALGYGMYPIKMVVRGDHTSVDFYMAVVPPKTECVVFSIDGSFTASMSVTGRDPKVRAGAVDIVRHWQELGYLIIYITGRPDMQQQKVEHGLVVHVAYGSSKDISVYTSIGLKPKQIFIVGKVSKKHHTLATALLDGYAAHLTNLLAHGGSRPAQGNARMVIPRGYFGLPGQNASLRRRRSAKRATSYPLMGGIGSSERSSGGRSPRHTSTRLPSDKL
ncbi:Protein retinal degeneration B [Blattella germanica]|nr:Protein retinal degeneration B [Blattella germanica]